MFNILKTATLSAMIALGAMAAATVVAQADNGPRYGSGERYDGPRGDNGNWQGNGWRHHDRRNENRWSCTPDRALDKAQRLGVRRAHIVDVDRRSIKVFGRKFGSPVRLTFARAPNCPIIRW